MGTANRLPKQTLDIKNVRPEYIKDLFLCKKKTFGGPTFILDDREEKWPQYSLSGHKRWCDVFTAMGQY